MRAIEQTATRKIYNHCLIDAVHYSLGDAIPAVGLIVSQVT